MENHIIMQRLLEKKSMYNVKKWQKDRENALKYISIISEFGNTNSLQKYRLLEKVPSANLQRRPLT